MSKMIIVKVVIIIHVNVNDSGNKKKIRDDDEKGVDDGDET